MTNDLIISACVRKPPQKPLNDGVQRASELVNTSTITSVLVNISILGEGTQHMERACISSIYGEGIHPALCISSIRLFLSCLMLFFENSFLLSLTVLVDYLSRAGIQPQMEFTTCLLAAKSCPALLQSHVLQPARLFCPRYFPGKNTGVGAISFSR